jgi:CheY-like chemotaxis protein
MRVAALARPKLLSWFITSAQANGIWFSEVLPSPWMARIMGSRPTRGFVARATFGRVTDHPAAAGAGRAMAAVAPHGPPLIGRCVEIAFRFGKQFAEETGMEREGCGQMPKFIVLVHSDGRFSDAVAELLMVRGHEVVTFAEPMPAIDALEGNRRPDVLITRTQFPTDNPTGLSLARMAQMKCPGIKVLITGQPHLAKLAECVGEFYPHPVDIPRLLDAVERMQFRD